MSEKNILIAVNKEHLDNILDGVKKIEWRKKALPLGLAYGYETKNKCGCGMVTGEFEVVENIKFNLHGDTYRPEWLAKGCVPYEFLVEYAKGAEYLYANIIGKAKRYAKPKALSEFKKPCDRFLDCITCKRLVRNDFLSCDNKITRPPQSWCYVEPLKENADD